MTHQKLVAESLAAVLTLLPHKLRKLFHRHQSTGHGREVHPSLTLLLSAPPTHLGGHVERDLSLNGAHTVTDSVAICAWGRRKQRNSEHTHIGIVYSQSVFMLLSRGWVDALEGEFWSSLLCMHKNRLNLVFHRK